MRLGIDCAFYRNSAALGAGWATPTWNLVDGIKDGDYKDVLEMFENTIRRGLGLKTYAAALNDVEFSAMLMIPDKVLFGGTVAVTTGNPDFDDFRAIAAAKRTKQPLDVMILDGPSTLNGVEGIRLFAHVAEFSEPQGNGDGLMMKVTFKPALPDASTMATSPTAVPGLNVRVAAGAPTFAAWNSDTFTYTPT